MNPPYIPMYRHAAPHTSKALDTAVSEAARSLAKRPRRPRRKWTGWLHGEHCWRGRLIELPGGEIAHLFGVLRNTVVWSRGEFTLPGGLGEPIGWGIIPARYVRLHRDPAAQLLGQRKRGVRERPSVLKAASARANLQKSKIGHPVRPHATSTAGTTGPRAQPKRPRPRICS